MLNWQSDCHHIKGRMQHVFIRLIILLELAGCGNATSPQTEVVHRAINLSAGYLERSVGVDGMLDYRINMDPAIEVKADYNILRHAGSIYAMSMYYHLYPDVQMKSAIERASRYLRDESIGPVSMNEAMLAVWSDPAVNQSSKPLAAKLGGTGLGLAALMSVEKFYPGFTPLSDLQALGQFIIFMQKEDGSFYSKYIPSAGGRWDEWQSLYYPGEAALGLLMLYEKDPADRWMVGAAKALEYMANARKHKSDIPADHWALLATEKVLSIANKAELPVSRELLINHAVQICDAILQEQIEEPDKPAYDGGFSADGRTTPTATRLEGLQAALNFLPSNHEIRKRIGAAVSRGISFLLRAQIREGIFIGAVPRATSKRAQDSTDAVQFNRRATEVRVDYVQHALSAMIQYVHLTSDKKL